METNSKILLKSHEVCKLLGISLRTLQTYRDEERFPYYQLTKNGDARYIEKEIYLWLETRKVNKQ